MSMSGLYEPTVLILPIKYVWYCIDFTYSMALQLS